MIKDDPVVTRASMSPWAYDICAVGTGSIPLNFHTVSVFDVKIAVMPWEARGERFRYILGDFVFCVLFRRIIAVSILGHIYPALPLLCELLACTVYSPVYLGCGKECMVGRYVSRQVGGNGPAGHYPEWKTENCSSYGDIEDQFFHRGSPFHWCGEMPQGT